MRVDGKARIFDTFPRFKIQKMIEKTFLMGLAEEKFEGRVSSRAAAIHPLTPADTLSGQARRRDAGPGPAIPSRAALPRKTVVGFTSSRY